MRLSVCLCTAVAASLLGLTPAKALTVAPFAGAPSGDTRNDAYPQVGWSFAANPSGTAQVNELGFWDEGSDGLAIAHTVGLYHFNGVDFTLLAKVDIQAGTASLLENGYRWESIPTVTLTDTAQDNGYYTLMASMGTDTWYNDTAGLTLDTTYGNSAAFGVQGRYASSAFPSVGGTVGFDGFGPIQYVGPNMGFVAVPEPSTVMLTLAGLGLAGLIRRKH